MAMAGLGALLLGDAIVLMLMGVFNFGVALPGAIGLGAGLLAWRWDTVARWRAAHRPVEWLWRAGWMVLLAWLVSVAWFFHFIGRSVDASGTAQVSSGAAMIVLGSGTPHCTVSPTLAARLDQGLVLAQRLPAIPVVVSGGQDFGLRCSEANVMADYMIGHGLPAGRLLREDRSTSTEENLRFSRHLLEQRGVSP